MAGLTVTTKETARPPGAEKRVVVEVQFDSSYLSEGESFKPSDVGLTRFSFAPTATLTNGSESEEYVGGCYYASEKLHLLNVKTGKEVASEKNMEKVKALVVCYGH